MNGVLERLRKNINDWTVFIPEFQEEPIWLFYLIGESEKPGMLHLIILNQKNLFPSFLIVPKNVIFRTREVGVEEFSEMIWVFNPFFLRQLFQ